MTDDATSAPPSPGEGAASTPTRRRRSWLLALAAALLVALAGLVGALVWSVSSETGSRLLLSWLPGLRVAAPSGVLMGDFAAERVELALPRGGSLVLTQLRWQGLHFERDVAAPWSLRLVVHRLEAERGELRWVPGPASTTPSAPLSQLQLPLGVEIGSLRLGELRLTNSTMAPVRDISAGLSLAGGAGTHRIDKLALVWDRLTLAADARLGAAAPMPLDARLDLRSVPAPAAPASSAAVSAPSTELPPWGASVLARGPLQRFALHAALRAQDQTFDARAEVTPFAPLPVSQVDASTRELNLAALWSGAPRTALSGALMGRLEPARGGARPSQPLLLQASLDNNAAGRWDEGRLPVRKLRAEARSDVRRPQQGELRIETLELGSASQAAGSLQGSGRWDGQAWSLTTNLQNIAPAGLHARAPAVLFGGPIAIDGSGGLPLPAATASAPAPGASAPAPAPLAVDVRAALNGRLLTRPGSAALGGLLAVQVDAGYKPGEVSVRKFEAKAAGAEARLKGEAERRGAAGKPGQWHLKGEATIENFDPRPWWPQQTAAPAPAAANPPARTGGRARGAAAAPAPRATAAAPAPRADASPRLNADASFDVVVPERATGSSQARSATGWVASWRGQARATLRDSQLAGVPLTGELSLTTDTAAQRVLTNAQLEAGGNRLALKGALDAASAQGSGDRWSLETRAPSLATLAPLLRLVSPAAALAGALEGQAEVQGRWPALTTRGELQGNALSGFGVSTQALQARWTLGTSPDDEMALQAEARQLALNGQTIDVLQAQLQGNGRAHRASLRAEVPPVRPPAGTAANGRATGAVEAMGAQRLLGQLEAEGGWNRDDSTGTLGWRGRVQRLEVRPAAASSASTGSPAQQQAWLRADPFDLAWASGQQGHQASVSPTRIAVLDAVLRLRRLEWARQPQQPTHLQVQGELEPLRVAPLLARLQPDFGWAGDLSVAGRLELRSSAQDGFYADALLERTGGDLSVVDPALQQGNVQRLGLSDLRLAFTAREGVWRFTQQLAGSNMGLLRGEQTVRTRRDATWPDAEAPIDGQLDVRVDNLGTWGAWVPAGWRLSGQLTTQAKVGGRFGAREFTGRLSGSRIGVRNVLQGVNVSDGELDVALQGETATIHRFNVRGGEGTARLEGAAVFGAKPRAELKLVAERFAVLSRVDRRVVASGDAQLVLEQDAVKLDGKLTADEGLIDISRGDAPNLSEDVVVVRRGEAAPEMSLEPPPSRLRNVALNIKADLGQNFRLRGRGIDTLLRGDLTITSPGGALAVNGTIRTEGGTYAAYAQKLSIERGIIAFTGPIENARMDILALRKQAATAIDSDVKVGVAITGTTQNPRVRLWSEPEMADTDKLSWLVLGRAPDSLGRNEAALLQQAALALLSGEGEGPTGNFLQAIGLDELSLRQEDDGTVRETVVSLGKQISRRWYVGYERSLSATTGNWQLIYRAAQRFTVRAQSGAETSIDAIWTWRWN